MANTIIYPEDWAVKAQERLEEPSKWKEICRVEYTNSRVLNNPYFTYPTVQSHTRGTAYGGSYQDVTLTNESITISTSKILPVFIDRADLAQTTYATQMQLAKDHGTLIDEAVESAMLASHSSWTDFGTASIGAGGTAGDPITVSASNIDDIIRGLQREISEANGDSLAQRFGTFCVWRPADFELLKAYMMANGFSTADNALRNGVTSSIDYMGMTHYTSNKHTANHVFAGVKNIFHLGIVRDTYGQVVIDEEPANGSGALSAIGIVMRVDYAFKAWANYVPVLFDVNVA